jgi:diamine N-acetyltransferase
MGNAHQEIASGRAAWRPDDGPFIRRTGPSDLDFVLALEQHPDNRSFIGQWSRDEHAAALVRPDREHWIVERGNPHEPVGYVILYDVIAAGYGVYVKRIAVADKSRGLGRRALAALVEHAFEDLAAPSVCLAVYPHNARARRSYAAIGFAEVTLFPDERRDMQARVDPFPDDCLILIVTADTFRKPDAAVT